MNWSRVAHRWLDPARVQRGDDFLAPDQPPAKVAKGNKKKAARKTGAKNPPLSAAELERQRLAKESRERRRAAERARKIEAQKRKAQAKAERQARAAVQRAESERRRAEKAARRKAIELERREARKRYMETPEYAAEVARKQAEMEAKKKTHLQAWIEDSTSLGNDRNSLAKGWRERLFRK